jgi:hypothetical protein
MITKLFEVRGRATCIAVMATRPGTTCEQDRYLLARSGFGETANSHREYVMLAPIDGGSGMLHCDPFAWTNRTLRIAHMHIKEHFDDLPSGSVVDVRFILGETDAPCVSDARFEPEV